MNIFSSTAFISMYCHTDKQVFFYSIFFTDPLWWKGFSVVFMSVQCCLNTNHANHIILLLDNIVKPNANDISYCHMSYIVKQYIKCITILIHQLADSPVQFALFLWNQFLVQLNMAELIQYCQLAIVYRVLEGTVHSKMSFKVIKLVTKRGLEYYYFYYFSYVSLLCYNVLFSHIKITRIILLLSHLSSF